MFDHIEQQRQAHFKPYALSTGELVIPRLGQLVRGVPAAQPSAAGPSVFEAL